MHAGAARHGNLDHHIALQICWVSQYQVTNTDHVHNVLGLATRDPVKPGTRNNGIWNNGIIIAHYCTCAVGSEDSKRLASVCCFDLLLLLPDNKHLR